VFALLTADGVRRHEIELLWEGSGTAYWDDVSIYPEQERGKSRRPQ